MRMKEDSEKPALKLNIQKTEIVASGPITLWQIGESGNSDRFYFLGLKITADSDCSYEIKRCLLLRKKDMTNLDILCQQRFTKSKLWFFQMSCTDVRAGQ